MKEFIKGLLLKLIGLVKIRPKFALGAGIILATVLYIYLPYILNGPYIRINDRIFAFELSLPFKQCKIYLKKNIAIDESGTLIYPYSSKSNQLTYSQKLNIISNTNPIIIDNPLSKEKIESTNADTVKISIKYKDANELDITKVLIDDNEKGLNLKTFFENNITSKNKAYRKRQLITEAISTILLHYNISISNFLLTLLTISLFVLFCNLGYKCTIYYLIPSNYFADFALKCVSGKPAGDKAHFKDQRIEYCLKFQEQDIWYRFLQILGPTVGFLLTTSSLIAALNPSLQASRDIKGFFDSIQVAMVSTFIGLLIRLVAMFLQRLNNKMLVRLDNTIFGEIID